MNRISLVYFNEQTLNKTERENSHVESARHVQDLNASGSYNPAPGSHQASTVTSRRVRNATPFMPDGPFLGAREQLNSLAGLQTELL
jgi:hypothetical protein